MRNIRRYIREESGTALLASFLFVVLITGAGMASVMATSVNQNASKNVLTSKQAFYLSEAGIQHAKTFLTQNQSNWNTYASATMQTLIAYTSLGSTGGYRVTVKDGGGGSLLLNSTGTASGNAQSVVQSLVTRTATYTPRYAFITGKNIAMNVNALIQGTSGGVHANGQLYIENSPTISTDATASGVYNASYGTPTVGGVSGGGKPLETIPAIRPSDFYASRDYLLDCDGNVYDVNGVLKATGSWNGWSYSGTCSAATWKMGSTSTINGSLYVNGDVVITGSVGTTASPWIVSIIATNSINVSSQNIAVRPPASTDGALYKAATQNILFLAGGDIYIHPPSNGSYQTFGTSASPGLIAAHEQIAVQGFSTLTTNGVLLAEDGATQSSLVSGDDYIGYCSCTATSGASKHNYSGAIVNPTLQGGTTAVQLMTWQVMQ